VKTILQEAPDRLRIARLTVDQYEAMIAQGILTEGEPIELLDGFLVLKDRAASGGEPMTIGPEHQLVLNVLGGLRARFEKHGCFLAIQGPVRLPPQDEPEPDGAVVVGAPRDYARRHPGARDLWSVIEVADSSLLRDRSTKLRIYAAAGIHQYVIVNLVERHVAVHEAPATRAKRYDRTTIHAGSQLVAIACGPDAWVKVKAKDLLP
jgi:Uma2 family endonuclease